MPNFALKYSPSQFSTLSSVPPSFTLDAKVPIKKKAMFISIMRKRSHYAIVCQMNFLDPDIIFTFCTQKQQHCLHSLFALLRVLKQSNTPPMRAKKRHVKNGQTAANISAMGFPEAERCEVFTISDGYTHLMERR